jgi:DNA invertase Pin-like site-specific DNA recombinase
VTKTPRETAIERLKRMQDSDYAAVVKQEREYINANTKMELERAKASGTTVGNPRLADARAKGTAAQIAIADDITSRILPTIESIQARGIVRPRAIAEELMRFNIRTARGSSTWYAAQVANILKRKP